jgi:hypothetical protein
MQLMDGLLSGRASRPRPASTNSEEGPAAGLMDTSLSRSHLALELNRAEVSDRRMRSGRIVEPLDIVELICSSLVPGAAANGRENTRFHLYIDY